MTNNLTLIHSLYDAFGRGDVAFILGKLSDDAELICEGPDAVPFCGTFRGRAGVAGFFHTLGTTQTEQRMAIDEIFEAGDKVVVVGSYGCTVTATNKEIDSKVVHIFTIQDGKVVRLLDFIDTHHAVQAYQNA
jgi:ketosteroid isomerase-like protein